MSQVNINIRMDEDLKKKFDSICSELGLERLNTETRRKLRKYKD